MSDYTPEITTGLETEEDTEKLPPAHKYQIIYKTPLDNKRRVLVLVSDPETLSADISKKLDKLTGKSYTLIEIRLKLWEVAFAEYIAGLVMNGRQQIYNTKYEDLMFDFAHQLNGIFLKTKQKQLRAIADLDGQKVVVFRRIEL